MSKRVHNRKGGMSPHKHGFSDGPKSLYGGHRTRESQSSAAKPIQKPRRPVSITERGLFADLIVRMMPRAGGWL